jgi:hypothetical protein
MAGYSWFACKMIELGSPFLWPGSRWMVLWHRHQFNIGRLTVNGSAALDQGPSVASGESQQAQNATRADRHLKQSSFYTNGYSPCS